MAERKPGPRARGNLAAVKDGAVLGVVTEVQMRFPKRLKPPFRAIGIELKLYFPVRSQKKADALMKKLARRCGRYDLAWALPVKP